MPRWALVGTLELGGIEMRKLFVAAVLAGLVSGGAFAQNTTFTYQGSLNDSGSPANGSYDFEFALFDASTDGFQQGSTVTLNGVAVTNGVFSVPLDFGDQFPGDDRYLEIRVRPAGAPGITILAPRQMLTSTPYAVKSLGADYATSAVNALNLGGVEANQYVLTGDPRLSDARSPLPESANYIQNQIAAPQESSNFSIDGSGRVAKLGVGVNPAFGLDVYAEIVAYFGLAFRDTAHRWRLQSTPNGLETFQLYNQTHTLVNMARVIVDDNGNVGVGTTAPLARLHSEATSGDAIYAHNVNGIALHARSENTDAAYFEGSTHFTRWITLDELSAAGSTTLCRNASNRISTCSSSFRYKQNIGDFNSGMELLNQLHPITFDWKDGGQHDLGLIAEEVEKVEPLLVTYNQDGQVEGVKYDRMNVVLINALREMESQVESQKKLIDKQGVEIAQLLAKVDGLRHAVCLMDKHSSNCPPVTQIHP